MTKVLVLGTTGMLGSMVLDWLRRDRSLRVSATARDGKRGAKAFDAERDEVQLGDASWVVNCIGVIKPFIHDDNREEVARAIRVNAQFPERLAQAAEKTGAHVLQIATDCVYSGRDGKYTETAAHDATDVYGKSKSLGEVNSPRLTHLRCSIIGPETKGFVSLLSWFQKQPQGAKLNGYRNHAWNGVTTLHYARICAGLIATGDRTAGVRHVIPTGDISKADLLRCFAREYNRGDMTIVDVDAPTVIDRRLRTKDEAGNARMWKAAGYDSPPTVEAMVAEMARHKLSV